MTTEAKKISGEKFLMNKKIEVRPIERSSPMFDRPVSISNGATISFDLPIDPDRRARIQIFSNEEEQMFFEQKLNLPANSLSIYDRKNQFWNEYRVIIPEEGLVLNLSNVSDLLKYKVLKANDHRIAPSWTARNDDARYRAALVEEGFENIEINKTQDKKKKAYIFLSKIENSVDAMIDVLNVLGKKINRNKGVSIDFVKAELYKFVEDTVAPPGEASPLDRFIEIAEDENFEFKVIIDKALHAKALMRIGTNGYRLPKGDEAIAEDTEEMVTWLRNPKNQIKVETIKAQIDTYFK